MSLLLNLSAAACLARAHSVQTGRKSGSLFSGFPAVPMKLKYCYHTWTPWDWELFTLRIKNEELLFNIWASASLLTTTATLVE